MKYGRPSVAKREYKSHCFVVQRSPWYALFKGSQLFIDFESTCNRTKGIADCVRSLTDAPHGRSTVSPVSAVLPKNRRARKKSLKSKTRIVKT